LLCSEKRALASASLKGRSRRRAVRSVGADKDMGVMVGRHGFDSLRARDDLLPSLFGCNERRIVQQVALR
jgi:hypothetical protein